MVYDVNVNMEPSRNVLRVCDALGGTMEPPSSKMELEIIEKKARRVCSTCYMMWIPAFRRGKEDWVYQNNEAALYLPCARTSLNSLFYFAVPCAQAIMFYCKIKDFQVFQTEKLLTENMC